MIITLIAAMDKNRAIGIDNTLPWHLPADLAHFKRITMGKPIMMGRKTYESIGRTLPGRTNIVISRNAGLAIEGCCVVVNSVDDGIKAAQDAGEIFIVGGASFYAQMIDKAQQLEITHVDAEITGDAFFPEIDQKVWQMASCEEHKKDYKNKYDYSFVSYIRRDG
jgi:dihydrofolate reductase